MNTLRKFLIYFLMFISLFLLIGFLTNYHMKETYKQINYEVKTNLVQIDVQESKASRTNGYIKGSVTNNSDEFYNIKYLKIDLFDINDVYLGSEYKELKYFHNNETINFEIGFTYNNVKKLSIDITDSIIESNDNTALSYIDMKDKNTKIAALISIPLILYTAFALPIFY